MRSQPLRRSGPKILWELIQTIRQERWLLKTQNVQDSSHTPAKAFSYILSQLEFRRGWPCVLIPATDDTVNALFQISGSGIQQARSQWLDFMVINVSKGNSAVFLFAEPWFRITHGPTFPFRLPGQSTPFLNITTEPVRIRSRSSTRTQMSSLRKHTMHDNDP